MATTTTEEHEELLQFAIDFALTGTYPSLDELTSDKRKELHIPQKSEIELATPLYCT